jgi:hypothetical protein
MYIYRIRDEMDNDNIGYEYFLKAITIYIKLV